MENLENICSNKNLKLTVIPLPGNVREIRVNTDNSVFRLQYWDSNHWLWEKEMILWLNTEG
jgi:hypothetical protein